MRASLHRLNPQGSPGATMGQCVRELANAWVLKLRVLIVSSTLFNREMQIKILTVTLSCTETVPSEEAWSLPYTHISQPNLGVLSVTQATLLRDTGEWSPNPIKWQKLNEIRETFKNNFKAGLEILLLFYKAHDKGHWRVLVQEEFCIRRDDKRWNRMVWTPVTENVQNN